MTETSTPPPITVVMPTRNQAGFIAQAVASVMAQGIPGQELVVVDGGSTDGTQALLAQLAAAHPGQLHWSSAPDGGPADAVNRAVARARGEVIGWLNADDLYTPGAAARALAHLRQHPQDVLVYGEGEHIAADGRVLGRYPTRGPQTPLAAWADGCHICQPTAFFRRAMFLSLGGLDTTLRTAFDYDFWLRVLKQHPGGVACLPQVQAKSRLHEGAITLRLREAVALEALQVLHRHMGPAPAHWLLTHFEEVMAGLPFHGHDEAPAPRLLRLVQRAKAWLSPEAAAALRAHVAQHRALQLATPHLFAAVHADGWAPPVLQLRLRQLEQPFARLRRFAISILLHGKLGDSIASITRRLAAKTRLIFDHMLVTTNSTGHAPAGQFGGAKASILTQPLCPGNVRETKRHAPSREHRDVRAAAVPGGWR